MIGARMTATRIFTPPRLAGYALLDSGGARRLERFGALVVDRPEPQALWAPRLAPERWRAADLVFERETDRGGRWEGAGAPEDWELRPFAGAPAGSWSAAWHATALRLRPTSFKHVGVFPEQAANWRWTERARELLGTDRPRLLNLFGYTGAASLLAALSGFEVTHVDASKTSLAWMRENLEASGLAADAVRVVLDDALGFARREVRREQRYEGILLDPPHYGRGPKGEKWQFEEGLRPLLEACADLLAERSFLVLSTYAIGHSPLAFANLLGGLEGGRVVAGELSIPEEPDDPRDPNARELPASGPPRLLPCGSCARWWRGFPDPDRATEPGAADGGAP